MKQKAAAGVWTLAGIAVAYFVIGRLGLLLAVPPGYATAVWPPSGLALAAVLLLGMRACPAVWAGSFVLNLLNAPASLGDASSLATSALIGGGAALQAAAGVWLIRRFVRDPEALTDPIDIFRFALLGGPVACLINATVGVATLVGAGLILRDSWFYSWWTWWAGDTIGVLIFTPAILILCRLSHPLWRRRLQTVFPAILVGFGIMVIVFASVRRMENDRILSEFRHQSQLMSERFQAFLKDHFEELVNVQAFYAASNAVDRDEFRQFTRPLLDRRPSLQAIEWCPRVADQDRERYEAEQRSEGQIDFSIKEIDSDARPRTSGRRDTYFPITYVEPYAGSNLTAYGFDFNSETRRSEALWRSVQSGRISMTAPLELIQNPNDPGFVAFLPIYDNNRSDKNPAAVTGVATLILDSRMIMDIFLKDQNLYHMHLYLFDVTDPGKPLPILMRNLDRPDSETPEKEWSEAVESGESEGFVFDVGGRRWRLAVYPTADALLASQGWLLWSILAGGMLFIGMLTVILMVLSGRESVIGRVVGERTSELSALNRFQKAILDSAESAIVSTTPDGVITSFNAGAERMLGYRAEEMVGLRTPGVFHDSEEVARRAEEFSKILSRPVPPGVKTFTAKSDAGLPNTHEWTFIRKDGSRFPALLTVSALNDESGRTTGYLGIASDLTELKTVEAERQAMIRILEESPDFIGTADMEGNLRYHNRAARRLVGFPEDQDMTGMKIIDMHPKWAGQRVMEKGIPSVLETGQWISENALLHRDGHEIKVLQTLFMIRDLSGRPWYLATIMRDITHLQRREDELKSITEKQAANNRELNRQRLAALNLMQDAVTDKSIIKAREAALEKSNKELEQFAYIASHDLQEPLRMVASYTQLLDRRYGEKLDDTAKEYIAYAVDGAVRMRRLIEDLLSYSRVQTQGKELVPTDLDRIFAEAKINLSAAIQEKHAEVLSDPLPRVRADESQMVRLFQNLIGNALKFTRPGTSVRVRVSAEDAGGVWRIRVHDNGIGIEPQYLERIFVIFKRLHSASEYPGTGIGLAVCQRIVERHGGRIWAESQPGEGSTFNFTIPKISA